MLIVTLPALYKEDLVERVLSDDLVDGVRLNIGAKNQYKSAKEAIEAVLSIIGDRTLFIDVKGRQLRVAKWTIPPFGNIELNHEFSVDLPAKIIFRGGDESEIRIISGKVIYVDPDPREALGEGQAVNIHGNNLKIFEYLTPEDVEYINAAAELGVHKYMLSFVEEMSDISDVLALDPKAEIYLKIESQKGLEFVRREYPALKRNVRLIFASDDGYINIGDDKTEIFDALDLVIKSDPDAIAASRILTSLERSETVSMQDLLSLRYLESIGFRSFMLSDGLSSRMAIFERAISVMRQYQNRTNNNPA
ncbi:MAG: hypothetical protein WC788_01850 [Candidatus Paceibacterota bacterium]|jgi:hypothetical protein